MMEGINFYINSPFRIIILIILIALIIFILALLYLRFNHLGKRVHFPMQEDGADKKYGPREWEKQMLALAETHKEVSLFRYSFVLDDYNQIAYKKLNKIRDTISELSTDIISLIPAARWLFDNFQMMYREIKKVRTSGNSYEVLPILKTKEYRGFPRIYVVAKKMVALSQGHLGEENIQVMLKAYQQIIPLTDKEIWVLPEMLSFCLLENIIEMSEKIIHVIDVKSKADRFVKERMEKGKSDYRGADITPLLSKLDSELMSDYSFHSHVIYLLKNMSINDLSVQRYIEYHFGAKGRQLKSSTIFIEEGKIESFLETNIRALIVSLRDINEVDEEKFFEQYSCLEKILSSDPAGIYAKMDPEARGMYREVVVKLSLKYRIGEEKIASDCLELAKEGNENLHQSHHVGSYLLGRGYSLLKAKILNQPNPNLLKPRKNGKGFLYFVSLFAIFALICGLIAYILYMTAADDRSYYSFIIILVGLPLYLGIAMELTNFIFTRRIAVKKIPSLDYLKYIPDSARTYIIMPVIISSKNQGLEYMKRLQKHYLANQQPNLFFALLVDFEDAVEPFLPKDEEIESALIQRMKELNEQYPCEHQRFSLFFRNRKFNKSENCYMGWERKRGKLEEFNNLLNGVSKDATTFSTVLCDEEILDSFRYVITLDADTNLLRDNAAKLVGLIDHPLNQPVLDEENHKVKEGYVIIQPSVRNHIVDKQGSRFAELFGGQSGLAHYGAVISDIYQDIFNEGIYIGKGIYDVQAFHKLLNNTIPENSVLSHDLLESCYARTAFSSTAKIMDTFPSSVISFAKREHRWIRGDWQLLPWIFTRKKVKGRGLCALARWKIFDNLRRSFVPLSKVLVIIFNLLWFPEALYLWLPLVFFSDVFQIIILLISVLTQKMLRPKLALVYKSFLRDLGVLFERAFLEFAITPYRAYIATDAMVRTLYRLAVSKKNLLRWNTAESVDSRVINTLKGYFLSMWISFLPALGLLVILCINRTTLEVILLYTVVAFVWMISFYLAYGISQPGDKGFEKEKVENQKLLQDTARRTWQFFKDFSVKENNYLCPDNCQMGQNCCPQQSAKVSDKTSPTNIGLQFLSILSARDFGYETIGSTVERTEHLMDSVQKMIKWRGHLYNWYEIKTLEVLNPAYISTVDSGNFLGHLVAMKNGLLEQLNQPVLTELMIKELNNTIARSHYPLTNFLQLNKNIVIGDFLEEIKEIWEDINSRSLTSEEDHYWIFELQSNIEHIVDEISAYKLKEAKLNSCPSLSELAEQENKNAVNMVNRIKTICFKIDNLISNADFGFLFDHKRLLFHIGYHVDSQTLDAGCYDLMASESALTSFLAIAKGEVPLKHWYKLGRPYTIVNGIPCFVSWSGTMFEYLMPGLVMKGYEGSVFSETFQAAVLQQMKYAKEAEIPWGISESQYYRFDLNSNYQYKAFGVPKIRLQPVRKNPLVVTPYATLLALDYVGEECISNLIRLQDMGVYGDYGFFEAVDFNQPNSSEMTPYCIVRSYMAHHQGMIMVAINNYLNHSIMRQRFHSDIMVMATQVLLEEKRQSNLISLAKRGYTIKIGKTLFREDGFSKRYVNDVSPSIPVANILSNNKYSLMITSDGDGFSKYDDLMLYRWRSDIYANTGHYIYIKDQTSGKVWSSSYHPTRVQPDEYQVIFAPHQAEFIRRDGNISTNTLVSLDTDHSVEIRKVSLTNHSSTERRFELTSYLEIVGDTHPAELSHPAFNKLFLESEYLQEHGIFLAKRRSKKGEQPYLIHMVRTGSQLPVTVEYENDRKKFIGRNHTLTNPESVMNSITFSNHSGFCNDPIMSLRIKLTVAPGETVCASFVTGVCESREEAVKLSEELNVCYRIDDIMEKFRLQKDIELKYLEMTRSQMNAFQDLISPIFYPSAAYRGPGERIRRNFKNQSFLWRFGVSGDNPILLLRVKSMEEEGIIKDVLKAYEYLRLNRVMVDLIILIEAKHGYLQEVADLINDMTTSMRIHEQENSKPSFFMIYTYQMIPAEIDLLYTVARVVFSNKTGVYFRTAKETTPELTEE